MGDNNEGGRLAALEEDLREFRSGLNEVQTDLKVHLTKYGMEGASVIQALADLKKLAETAEASIAALKARTQALEDAPAREALRRQNAERESIEEDTRKNLRSLAWGALEKVLGWAAAGVGLLIALGVQQLWTQGHK